MEAISSRLKTKKPTINPNPWILKKHQHLMYSVAVVVVLGHGIDIGSGSMMRDTIEYFASTPHIGCITPWHIYFHI